jgi:phosphatidate cytidylyltransferase
LLTTRILTGVGIAVVVLGTVLWLDPAWAALVFGAVWIVGAAEWAGLAGLGLPGRAAYAGVAALLIALLVGLGGGAWPVPALLWAAAVIWLVTFGLVLRFPPPLPLAVLLPAGILVLGAAWTSLFVLHGTAATGPGLVLTGLSIVWSADIGAYFVGRSIGRTPLAPRVSPKKTWEGVAGGVALAALTGAIAARWLGLPQALLIPLAAALALVSVVGDLGISMLKRWAGKKDSGMLLPGHGGILDRFDGVTAALPFYVIGLQFAHVLD